MKIEFEIAYLTYTIKLMTEIVHMFVHFLVEDQFRGFAVSSSTGSFHHTTISVPPSGTEPLTSPEVGVDELSESDVFEVTFSLLGTPLSIFWSFSKHVMTLLLELLIVGTEVLINRVRAGKGS